MLFNTLRKMNAFRLARRVREGEEGITALETAIILIAFVVVAAVFAFTVLSAGTFSTERSKEAVYAGLSEVRSSMEIKGGVIALASTAGTSATVDSLVFTVSSAMGGEGVNLATDEANQVVNVEYRDSVQRKTIDNWTVNWLVQSDDDAILETGELAEITVPLVLSDTLSINTTFALEIKPPSGAVFNLQRTTPAYIEMVNDLN
jgi:flagellin FlaB